MALAYASNSGSAASASAGTAVSVSLGAAPTVGNLLVAIVGADKNTTLTGLPSGWSSGTLAETGTGTSQRLIQAFWKISTGSDGTFSCTLGTSANWSAGITEYSGVDGTTPLDVENAQTTASATTHTTPTVTPTASVARLIVFGTWDRSIGTWSTQQVNSSATGVAERIDKQASSVSSLQMADLIVASTTGTYSASAVCTVAGVGAAAIAIFKAAAATKSPPPYSRPWRIWNRRRAA